MRNTFSITAVDRLGLCPNPMKAAYASRSEARRAAKRQVGALGRLNEYLCECGAWHLTSRKKHFSRTV